MLVICMDEQIKKEFAKLKVTGQRYAVSDEEKREKDILLISYLNSIIDNKEVTNFEDIGFCYWNVSDNYALLKDGHSLYNNHIKFYEYIKQQDVYLFWLVCDATQRLTLHKDGYNDFWWNLYRMAVEKNKNNLYYFAEFNAHRAALYVNERVKISQDNFIYAKSNFEKLLEKTQQTPEYRFYKTIYISIILKFSNDYSISEICELSETLFDYLAEPQTTNDFLVGEWKSIITPYSKRKQGVVGITSAINTLIYTNNIKEAKELYYNACDFGLPKNHYIELRIKEK